MVAQLKKDGGLSQVIPVLDGQTVCLAFPGGALSSWRVSKILLKKVSLTVRGQDPGDPTLPLSGSAVSVDLGLFQPSLMDNLWFPSVEEDIQESFVSSEGYFCRPYAADLASVAEEMVSQLTSGPSRRSKLCKVGRRLRRKCKLLF